MYQYTPEEKNKLLEHENSILKKEMTAHQEEAVHHFIAREQLKEALRKAILWAEGASTRITDREGINWTYLEEARRVLDSQNADGLGRRSLDSDSP